VTWRAWLVARSLTTRPPGISPYLLLMSMAKRGVEVRTMRASRSRGQKVLDSGEKVGRRRGIQGSLNPAKAQAKEAPRTKWGVRAWQARKVGKWLSGRRHHCSMITLDDFVYRHAVGHISAGRVQHRPLVVVA